MERKTNRVGDYAAAALLVGWIIPMAWLIGIVARYAVNVPYWDEWALSYFLTAAHARGYPAFVELFMQDNETRDFFPRLIFFYLAQWTHWNLRVQILFNTGVMVLAACGLLILIWRRFAYAWQTLLVAMIANFIFFSPGQWENWLWGIQLIVFVPLTALIWALVICDRSGLFWLRFCGAAILALISTYSYANGMALWPILLPSVALCAGTNARNRAWGILLWIACAVASIGLYFHGYVKPPGTPPFSFSLHHPLRFAHFFVRFIGNGIRMRDSGPWPAIFGSGALGGVLLAMVQLLRDCRSGQFLQSRLPWFVLIGYTLISAGTATLGRVGWGVQYATGSRYEVFSMPLFIGLLVLGAMWVRQWRLPQAWIPPIFFSAGVLATIAAIGLSQTWTLGIKQSRDVYFSRLAARVHVQFYPVLSDNAFVAAQIFPMPDLFPERIAALDQAGLLSCGLIKDRDISKIAAKSDPNRNGSFDVRIKGSDAIISGWASSDDGKRPADAVLLTTTGSNGTEQLLTIVDDAHESRDDVAAFFHRPALKRCGFRKIIPVAQLPTEKTVTAWGFDTNTRRAFRLPAPQIAR